MNQFDIYYHVACGLPSSTQVIASQYPILSIVPYRRLYICLLGDEKSKKDARILLSNLRDSEIFHEGALEEYEHPTLEYMQNTINVPSIYMHTKGARHSWTKKESQLYHKWRSLLDHRVVRNGANVIKKMISGACDMAGALYIHVPKQYRPEGVTYFAGNYFAITPEYCKDQLPVYRQHANSDDWEGRYQAETWVSFGKRAPRVLTIGQEGAYPLKKIVHQVSAWKR